jgi:putative ABC transport system permease protein
MNLRGVRVVTHLFLRAASLERKRAMLTVAAIAWGTVSIVLLLAFGEGLQQQMMRGRRGMGENIAVWWPGETSKPWQGLGTGRPIRPRVEDVAFLRQKMSTATAVVGEISAWQTNLIWGRKSVNAKVTGVSWQYGEIRHHFPRPGGRFLNALDEAHKRRVAFLGEDLAVDIFGDREPVGETLQVAGAPYLVVGVAQPKLQMGTYGGPDANHAVVPITTLSTQLGRQRLSNIVLKVAEPEHMPAALDQFADALSSRYRFDPTDEQVMGVWDTVESSAVMRNIMVGLKIFLGVIGCLTLVIGGVGVANIMFAVVKESTRAIGVQMAVGARRGWITGPFVLQGLTYTLLGGAAGMAVAVVLIVLLGLLPTAGSDALEFMGKPTLSWRIAALTAGVLGTIGMLAGYFPARRAASIDPAETLRYE